MNVWKARNVGMGRVWVNTILAGLSTRPAAALLPTPKLRLSSDPGFNPTPASVIADLTPGEIIYSGYTSGGETPTVSVPIILSTSCQGVLVSAVFLATAATPFVAANATGWWLDDGTDVAAYERFDPLDLPGFGAPGDWLDLDALIPFQLLQATI